MIARQPLGRALTAGAAATVGVVIALPTLAFPFGRDQGLYYYVAREWLDRGALPYRDLLEQKTPGIYLVYALAIRLFGENMWGIRVLDLFAFLAIAVLGAFVSARVDAWPTPETLGVGILTTALVYEGVFDFWNTAQCEVWVCVWVLAGCVALRRIRSLAIAAASSGLSCGLALLTKPPAAFMVCVCAALLVVRLRTATRRVRDTATALGLFVACAAIPSSVTLIYFAAHGALGDLYDVLVGANGYYATHELAADNLPELLWRSLDGGRLANPIAVVAVYASVVAYLWSRRRGGERAAHPHAIALGLAVAAWMAVTVQRKFYHYHFVLMVPGIVVAVTSLVETLAAVSDTRGWPLWRAPAFVAANAVLLFALSYQTEYAWFPGTKHAFMRWFRLEDVAAFESAFRNDALGFDFREEAEAADWLRTHARPTDQVAVRGFEPGVYARSGLHYGGRFFWTSFLTMPSRAYRRADWLAQDRQDLARIRPRFVVAIRGAQSGPDSAAYFSDLGYLHRMETRQFDILELAPE